MAKEPESLDREWPGNVKRITTGCQYCAVGCGYNAFLMPTGEAESNKSFAGVSSFVTPAMQGSVNYQGIPHQAVLLQMPAVI